MTAIRVMPELVSNQIAAGEVVERPASVVKELVENAIDAGSSRILVEIEKGGRRLIRVSDNGCGMARDDALLAIERYATSKIHDEKDLFAIATLGFRGEALPSIASVSRMSLVTRSADMDEGTRMVIHGGRLVSVSAAGAPEGTMIGVEALFYNTPARRKFLKSVNTEMGHIADTLAQTALGWPGIRFRLLHDGRLVKDWAAGEARLRVLDVLGKDLAPHLVPISEEMAGARITGWVATSRETRSTNRHLHVFVNGRYVRDRVIRHALLEGYAGRLMKGRFPVAVVYLEVPSHQVDVNVHPTKHEIRFERSREIHDFVVRIVSSALGGAERPAWVPGGGHDFPEARGVRPVPGPSRTPVEEAPPLQRALFREASDPLPFGDRGTGQWEVKEAGGMPLAGRDEVREADRPTAGADLTLTVIGQFQGTYILCESRGEDLVLIDQHAAHERIVFEKLKRRRAAFRPPAQRLAVPETIELGFREAAVLNAMMSRLVEAGLEIAPFGGNTFIVQSVPDLLSGRPVAPLIRELVENEGASDGPLEEALDAILATMACHSVVRAREPLNREQMQALVSGLFACSDPGHCPHGRPTWIRWSLKELEKLLGRTL